MMRIAFFTDTYLPQVNGVVTSIRLFARHLSALGHEVTIVAPEKPWVRFFPYPEYHISFPVRHLFDNRYRSFDVVHVHTPATMGLLGVAVAKRYGIPLVGTYHTLLPEYVHYLTGQGAMRSAAIDVLWRYTRWFYNQCDEVVVPSPETKATLESHGIRNIAVIPTGIGPVARLSREKARASWRFSGTVALHVGRVTMEKNIEFLIGALGNSDVALVIASDGPHRSTLERMVSERGIRNVRFTGYLNAPKLASLYAAADVFVASSGTETQSLVLLEAAASGLPVVVLDAPVLSRFVRKNGIGIVSGPGTFLRGVRAAVRRRRRFAAGRAQLVRKYDMGALARSLTRVYERAGRRTGTGSPTR